ncbi:MAG: histidinol dehydrogenase [Chloroflexi bacterium]|nr:histidinol dehydrogenase [Chloroflexota bacterium]
MAVIPAQVAGVAEIIIATPPDQKTGKVADVVLPLPPFVVSTT